MNELGIETLKKALKFVGNLSKSITHALEDDGHIKGMEYFSIAGSMTGIIPVLANIGDLIAEYKDLYEEEQIELKEYFKNEFDIPDDQVEDKIEKAFEILMDLGDGLLDLFSSDN